MKPANFFFSVVIDLNDHSFPKYALDAMHAIHEACRRIDKPSKYGSSIEIIHIDVIMQDHKSNLFKPSIRFWAKRKMISAGVKIDIEKVLVSDFIGMVKIYQNVIFEVLNKIESRMKEHFDFESLKNDLNEAIKEEIAVI